MVKVLVRQYDMPHRAPSDGIDIATNGGRLGQRRTGVHQQGPRIGLNQTDRDVQERQPAAMDAIGERFPIEVHSTTVMVRGPCSCATRNPWGFTNQPGWALENHASGVSLK